MSFGSAKSRPIRYRLLTRAHSIIKKKNSITLTEFTVYMKILCAICRGKSKSQCADCANPICSSICWDKHKCARLEPIGRKDEVQERGGVHLFAQP